MRVVDMEVESEPPTEGSGSYSARQSARSMGPTPRSDSTAWVDDMFQAYMRNRLRKAHRAAPSSARDRIMALLILVLFFLLSAVFYGGGHGGGPNSDAAAAAAAAAVGNTNSSRSANATDWTVVDTLYFAVTTCTTVGYGDLHPTTLAGKLFTICFIAVGIGMAGVALGHIVDIFIANSAEMEAKAVSKLVSEAKSLRRNVRRASMQAGIQLQRISAAGKAAGVKMITTPGRNARRSLGRVVAVAASPFGGSNVRQVAPQRSTPPAEGEARQPALDAGTGGGNGSTAIATPSQKMAPAGLKGIKRSKIGSAKSLQIKKPAPMIAPASDIQQQEGGRALSKQRRDSLRRRLRKAGARLGIGKHLGFHTPRVAFARRLLGVMLPLGCFMLLGLCMGLIEGWDFVDGLYAAVITLTAVGYGDFAPETQVGRGLAIVYIPFGLAVLFNTYGNIAQLVIQFRHGSTGNTVPLEVLLEMDKTGNGLITQSEFLQFMLVNMNKVEQETLDAFCAQYQALLLVQKEKEKVAEEEGASELQELQTKLLRSGTAGDLVVEVPA